MSERTAPADIFGWLREHRAELGDKPEEIASGRREEARRLTALLRSHPSPSFVRIGDFDVALLLWPEAAAQQFALQAQRRSGTEPAGSPGLGATHVQRLRASLSRAAYVDFHERLWRDPAILESLRQPREPGATQNASAGTSYILPTWLEHEFKTFCEGRRVLFCGAEAPLLEELLRDAAFRRSAAAYWPGQGETFFLRPRADGRDPGLHLDAIKADLRDAVERNRADTLFLSLGGAAKILCAELAHELGITAIDFGAGLRALTYSGSDGNRAARSTHFVFLHRVPFTAHMEAVRRSYPQLSPEDLLAKAHAQLLLELQRKEIGWSHHAAEYDFSPQNIATFRAALAAYRKAFRPLFRCSAAARSERARFLHFCGTHGLSLEGRLFLAVFRAKGAIASLLTRLRRRT